MANDRRLFLALALVLTLVACAMTAPTSSAAPLDRIRVRNRQFVDSYGRVRLFHGVNDVKKSEPYYSSFTDAELTQMTTEWGFNVLRLGFSWEGYERQRGVKDPAYMEETSAMVTRLSTFGLYTIVDVHQDLFSRVYCGNGFPDWTVYVDPEVLVVAPFPIPVLGDDVAYTPDPVTGKIRSEDCARSYWGTYYFSNVTGSIFQSFYNNVGGVQTSFVDMWRDLASKFRDRPEVFGYEIINEPFPGNIFVEPRLLLNSTYADETLLQPLYDLTHAAIRAVDDQTLFMIEPLVSNSEVAPRKSGLRTPGGPDYADRGVYAFHWYCLESETRPDYCANFLDVSFAQRERDAERLGMPKMLTEFGHLYGSADDQARNDTRTADKADEALVSWATWDYGFVKTRPAVIAALARPYARAIAGQPLLHRFVSDTRQFTLQYRVDLAIAAPTEIFVPVTIHYQSGMKVVVEPSNAATWTMPEPYLLWVEPTASATPGQVIAVTVTAVDSALAGSRFHG